MNCYTIYLNVVKHDVTCSSAGSYGKYWLLLAEHELRWEHIVCYYEINYSLPSGLRFQSLTMPHIADFDVLYHDSCIHSGGAIKVSALANNWLRVLHNTTAPRRTPHNEFQLCTSPSLKPTTTQPTSLGKPPSCVSLPFVLILLHFRCCILMRSIIRPSLRGRLRPLLLR
jgi:hypothetical protein